MMKKKTKNRLLLLLTQVLPSFKLPQSLGLICFETALRLSSKQMAE